MPALPVQVADEPPIFLEASEVLSTLERPTSVLVTVSNAGTPPLVPSPVSRRNFLVVVVLFISKVVSVLDW